MFIELAEFLRCPADHAPAYCVITPAEMEDRGVLSGVVGCPICEAEYPITDGVVRFGADPLLGRGSRSDDLTVEEMPSAHSIWNLLALGSPGGYVILLGSPARLVEALAAEMDGIHYIGVNAPPEVQGSAELSLLTATASIPLRSDICRGVVVGREYAEQPWLGEGARVTLEGGRMVVAKEDVEVTSMNCLAVGQGLWVGDKKRAR
ncbi:MAG: hypothetical protein AMS18_00875 [Gemmatimonas sp. SG8_17]|nr:MAG: hypothetical protein AMS18_00875 [Gemmatimonas sp. SG8_17]